VLGDAGLIFPEGDTAALASHLRRLLSDAPLRPELGSWGRERVLKLFSTEKVAAQHHNIYEVLSTEYRVPSKSQG
jgi:glycosyltransferase involved in cell wall biosynthesis